MCPDENCKFAHGEEELRVIEAEMYASSDEATQPAPAKDNSGNTVGFFNSAFSRVTKLRSDGTACVVTPSGSLIARAASTMINDARCLGLTPRCPTSSGNSIYRGETWADAVAARVSDESMDDVPSHPKQRRQLRPVVYTQSPEPHTIAAADASRQDSFPKSPLLPSSPYWSVSPPASPSSGLTTLPPAQFPGGESPPLLPSPGGTPPPPGLERPSPSAASPGSDSFSFWSFSSTLASLFQRVGEGSEEGRGRLCAGWGGGSAALAGFASLFGGAEESNGEDLTGEEVTMAYDPSQVAVETTPPSREEQMRYTAFLNTSRQHDVAELPNFIAIPPESAPRGYIVYTSPVSPPGSPRYAPQPLYDEDGVDPQAPARAEIHEILYSLARDPRFLPLLEDALRTEGKRGDKKEGPEWKEPGAGCTRRDTYQNDVNEYPCTLDVPPQKTLTDFITQYADLEKVFEDNPSTTTFSEAVAAAVAPFSRVVGAERSVSYRSPRTITTTVGPARTVSQGGCAELDPRCAGCADCCAACRESREEERKKRELEVRRVCSTSSYFSHWLVAKKTLGAASPITEPASEPTTTGVVASCFSNVISGSPAPSAIDPTISSTSDAISPTEQHTSSRTSSSTSTSCSSAVVFSDEFLTSNPSTPSILTCAAPLGRSSVESEPSQSPASSKSSSCPPRLPCSDEDPLAHGGALALLLRSVSMSPLRRGTNEIIYASSPMSPSSTFSFPSCTESYVPAASSPSPSFPVKRTITTTVSVRSPKLGDCAIMSCGRDA